MPCRDYDENEELNIQNSELSKKNHQLEIELCEARTTLHLLFKEVDKQKISQYIKFKVEKELEFHRKHREKDKEARLSTLNKKLKNAKEKFKYLKNSLVDYSDNLNKLTSEIAKIEKEINKIESVSGDDMLDRNKF